MLEWDLCCYEVEARSEIEMTAISDSLNHESRAFGITCVTKDASSKLQNISRTTCQR